MKKNQVWQILLICFMSFILFKGFTSSKKIDYLGQEPPGLEAKVFAPGIVSTEEFMEASCTFFPDGKEFYFTRGKSFQERPEIIPPVSCAVSRKNASWPRWSGGRAAILERERKVRNTPASRQAYAGWVRSEWLRLPTEASDQRRRYR